MTPEQRLEQLERQVRRANRTDIAALAVVMAGLILLAPTCKRHNHAPDPPSAPTGPTSGFVDSTYFFTASATDPDGDSVSIRLDWGDDDFSDWSSFVAPGDTTSASRAWSDTGAYRVSAQAIDTRGMTSDWSEPLKVGIGVWVNHRPAPPHTPNGPYRGYVDSLYWFAVSTEDEDGDEVKYTFVWGDGDTSISGAVPSDSTFSLSHSWHCGGTYEVTVLATDVHGDTSDWSNPATISIEALEGQAKWRYKTEDDGTPSSPAIGSDGTVYFGAADSHLYALNPDGSLKWRFATRQAEVSTPAVGSDGTIYFGAYDSIFYALNQDGRLRWRFVAGKEVTGAPAIGSDGTIYFGSRDDHLYALNSNGVLRWRYKTGGSISRSAPAIAGDGTIYAVSLDDYVYALNPDGTLKWRYDAISAGYSSPALGSDGTIYVGTKTGCLLALNPDSTLQWCDTFPDDIRSSPAVGPDGTVYVGCDDHRLYALNPDGTLRWSYLMDGYVRYAAPAVLADGTICVGSRDHCLYLLNPDGTLRWRCASRGRLYDSSPAVAPDGTIYVTASISALYAIRGSTPLADSPWPKFQHDNQNTGRAR